MNQKEFTNLLKLMQAIQNCSSGWVRNLGRNKGILLKEPYKQRPENIQHILRKDGAGDFGKEKIILPTPEHLPKKSHLLLSCKWDFSQQELEFRLRYGFLSSIDEKDKFYFSGFRCEAPEGPGNHNYYHAQPITSFEKNDNSSDHEYVENSKHSPTRLPTFPLRAENPFQLLACVLMSIYGHSGLGQFIEQLDHAQTKKELQSYLGGFK